jgi:hypothetical protein
MTGAPDNPRFDAEVATLVAEFTRRLTELSEEDEEGQQALFDELAARVAAGDRVAIAAMAYFASRPPREPQE